MHLQLAADPVSMLFWHVPGHRQVNAMSPTATGSPRPARDFRHVAGDNHGFSISFLQRRLESGICWQELLPEQLQTPPRVVSDRTPVVARQPAAPLSLAPSGLAADEQEALARVSDPPPADVEVRARLFRLQRRSL